MQEKKVSGYIERDHTADWALDVWAPDFITLLKEAADGMFTMMGGRIGDSTRQSRRFILAEPDWESLLVAFLSELVFLNESERLGFDRFRLTLNGLSLDAELEGGEMVGQAKQIKAVTFHNLEIRTTSRGLETTVVFDV